MHEASTAENEEEEDSRPKAAVLVAQPARKRGRPEETTTSSISPAYVDVEVNELVSGGQRPKMNIDDKYEDDNDDDDEPTTTTTIRNSQTLHETDQQKVKDSSSGNHKGHTGYSCPYCNKRSVSSFGLRYHVDNFVCRPSERPGGPVKKGSNQKGYSSISPFACLYCNKLYGSSSGLRYHVDNFACRPSERPLVPVENGGCRKTSSDQGVPENRRVLEEWPV